VQLQGGELTGRKRLPDYAVLGDLLRDENHKFNELGEEAERTLYFSALESGLFFSSAACIRVARLVTF
jgi:hypothetical protein